MEPLGQQLEDILKCPLCLDTVGNEPKTLRMCGHTFCHNCFMLWAIRKEFLNCPVCRIESYVGMVQGRVGDRGAGGTTVIAASAVGFLTAHRRELDAMKCCDCKLVKDQYLCLDCSKKNVEKAKSAEKAKIEYEYDVGETVYETIQKRLSNDANKVQSSPEKDKEHEQSHENAEDDEKCNIM